MDKAAFQYAVSYDCPNTSSRLQTMWYDSLEEAQAAMGRFREQRPKLKIRPSSENNSTAK